MGKKMGAVPVFYYMMKMRISLSRKIRKTGPYMMGFIVGVAITVVGEVVIHSLSQRRERTELRKILTVEIEKNQGILSTKLVVAKPNNPVKYIVNADPFTISMINFDVDDPIFKTGIYKSSIGKIGLFNLHQVTLISTYYEQISALERYRKRIKSINEKGLMTPTLDSNLRLVYIPLCKATMVLGDSILGFFNK